MKEPIVQTRPAMIPSIPIIGAVMLAAVPDPWIRRISVNRSKGNSTPGTPILTIKPAMILAAPESLRTSPIC